MKLHIMSMHRSAVFVTNLLPIIKKKSDNHVGEWADSSNGNVAAAELQIILENNDNWKF